MATELKLTKQASRELIEYMRQLDGQVKDTSASVRLSAISELTGAMRVMRMLGIYVPIDRRSVVTYERLEDCDD